MPSVQELTLTVAPAVFFHIWIEKGDCFVSKGAPEISGGLEKLVRVLTLSCDEYCCRNVGASADTLAHGTGAQWPPASVSA